MYIKRNGVVKLIYKDVVEMTNLTEDYSGYTYKEVVEGIDEILEIN